jgi:uncharacterized damage-inducible protein DinB
MTTRDDLPALYAYTRWADGRMIEAVRRLSPEHYVKEPAPGWASVRSTLVHMGGAMRIWSRRLDGETVTQRPTEAEVPTPDDAERLLRDGHDAFDRLVAGLTPESLAAVWAYQNLQGERSALPLWAVYRHVVNHQTYHRGQVASKLKLLGVEPPVTDLVYWAIGQTPQE